MIIVVNNENEPFRVYYKLERFTNFKVSESFPCLERRSSKNLEILILFSIPSLTIKMSSSCSSLLVALNSLVISLMVIVIVINVNPVESRIDSKSKEIDPRILEEKFQSDSSSDIQPASDALQHFLKELDRYVAIAGRPRFGRSAYKIPKTPIADYFTRKSVNEFRFPGFYQLDV